jgi:hypothetical protein
VFVLVLLFHGAAGGWDELAIALVAFGVLWVAVKLAGRKSAGDDDEDEADEAADAAATAGAGEDDGAEAAKPPARQRG